MWEIPLGTKIWSFIVSIPRRVWGFILGVIALVFVYKTEQKSNELEVQNSLNKNKETDATLKQQQEDLKQQENQVQQDADKQKQQTETPEQLAKDLNKI